MGIGHIGPGRPFVKRDALNPEAGFGDLGWHKTLAFACVQRFGIPFPAAIVDAVKESASAYNIEGLEAPRHPSTGVS
jgi:hypothetical protein